MTLDNNECYAFGDFALYPHDRLLTRFNKTVNLAGRDFDLLAYFVQHAGVLVLDRELVNAVWGEGQQISVGNITNHISKIRKALNCDKYNPRFIETYHGKRAYRFIAQVSQSQKSHADVAESSEKAREFTIESHLIAPVFLGRGAYKNISGSDKETTWATYKEFKIDNGRLCVLPTGIGVWHLTEKHQFSSLSDVAAWRRETYDRILNDKHIVRIYNEELKVPLISRSTYTFGSTLGKIGYVFSMLVLEEPKWVRPGTLRKALQLLSCLSPLENLDLTAESADSVDLERKLLDGTYLNLDTLEFGSPGHDLGYGSWDGLSYLQRTGGNSAFKDDIIEFEIAVQATWWLSKCLYDICLAKGAKVKEEFEPSIQELKWQYAKLLDIVATESTAQRTMIEAILTTSRLQRLVDDTIKLYGQF